MKYRPLVRLLFIILFFTLYLNVSAQTSGVLRGFITDSLSGEALAYGNVFIQELKMGASADERGYYLFPAVPAPGSYLIVISYVGYQTKEIRTGVLEDKTTLLNVALTPVSVELQTVEKIGERTVEKNESDLGVYKAAIKELETIPQGVETDIIRSLQYLPGVSITSDVTAKYYVRGGLNNQNLVLLNDAVIYNPFHALGMFSIVDPEMINTFEFFKGGFPTQYSGRISSILNLTTKDGNKNSLSGKAAVSLLTSKAVFEGPIPHGSFIATGRKSISNAVLKKFYNDGNVPVDFFDLSFKVNYSNQKFWKDANFIVHGFVSEDRITNNDPLRADYSWKNSVYGIRYRQVSDSPLFYEISFAWSNFDGAVEPKRSDIKPKKNEIRDFNYKGDFTYIYPSKDELSVGLKINGVKTRLYLQNSFGLVSDIGPAGDNASISAYGKYRWLRFKNVGIETGMRIGIVTLPKGGDSDFPIEPRLSLTYTPYSNLKLQASAGAYNQELTTLSDEDEVISIFEPWLILPDYIGLTKSFHYSAGIDLSITDSWKIETEGYYKKTNNLPLLNKDKIFPSDPDLLAGSSEAYGVEFLNRFSRSYVSFTSTYALAWIFNSVGGREYNPNYDIRHAVTLVLEFNFGKGWSFSSVWNYKSGFPFTKLSGYYDKFYFNLDPGEFSDFDFYSRYTLLDSKNSGRTPDYHKLDLNLSKKIDLEYLKLFISFSLLNVYDRANLFYFERETGQRVNMLPFLPSFTLKAEI